MEKSSPLCELFLLLSVLVCLFVPHFVSADTEVNMDGWGGQADSQLITLTTLNQTSHRQIYS